MQTIRDSLNEKARSKLTRHRVLAIGENGRPMTAQRAKEATEPLVELSLILAQAADECHFK